jgi:hypothetical protein
MRTPVVVVCPNDSTYRVTYAEAERLVSQGRAHRESKKLIRLSRDRSGLSGRMRVRQSGRYGPLTVQGSR